MIIIRNNIIPFPGYSAMTLWPFIFVRRTARYTDTTDRHERIHGRQQVEMLILPFYLWYLVEWLVRLIITGSSSRAYRSISFEQEAYNHERDADYLASRPFFAWLKYVLRK